MSELEYSLKEIVNDLRETVKDLEKTVNNMSNNLSNEYQKKTDCVLHRGEIQSFKNQAIGWIIGVYSLVIAAITVLVSTK